MKKEIWTGKSAGTNFVMQHKETEISEKTGDKGLMEKSNTHSIVETKEKEMAEENIYILMDKMTENYPVMSIPKKRKKEKQKGRRKVWVT